MKHRDEYPQPVIVVQRVRYTPVIYEADGLITLVQAREARRLRNAGTVGWLSKEDWERIRTTPTGYNLDPAFA